MRHPNPISQHVFLTSIPRRQVERLLGVFCPPEHSTLWRNLDPQCGAVTLMEPVGAGSGKWTRSARLYCQSRWMQVSQDLLVLTRADLRKARSSTYSLLLTLFHFHLCTMFWGNQVVDESVEARDLVLPTHQNHEPSNFFIYYPLNSPHNAIRQR